MLHFHPEAPPFPTAVRLQSPTLTAPRQRDKWNPLALRKWPFPPSMSAAAWKPLQTFLRFLHKETFAFVGREHRKGTISNHTWFLWRRGRLQRWDFSSNEGRLPGAGVWDRPSLTQAWETIKAKEMCHWGSTQRCEKREIKLEADLFYHSCWGWSGWNPATVCF